MSNYKAALRGLMERKGLPVKFAERRHSWDPEVSTYGWTDYDAQYHILDDKCGWVVPEGATLTEKTYSQFTDTFHDNEDEVGINVTPAHCHCGRYTEVTLRYSGSLGDTIREITGETHSTQMTL